MSTFSTVSAAVQLAVVSLLIDRRVLSLVLSLTLVAATLILGGDAVEARRNIIGGGPYG